jgi:nitrate reductase delta subunit
VCEGEALAALMQEPDDDPRDLAALDKAWAETPVTFGPSDVGCPKAATQRVPSPAAPAARMHTVIG